MNLLSFLDETMITSNIESNTSRWMNVDYFCIGSRQLMKRDSIVGSSETHFAHQIHIYIHMKDVKDLQSTVLSSTNGHLSFPRFDSILEKNRDHSFRFDSRILTLNSVRSEDNITDFQCFIWALWSFIINQSIEMILSPLNQISTATVLSVFAFLYLCYEMGSHAALPMVRFMNLEKIRRTGFLLLFASKQTYI